MALRDQPYLPLFVQDFMTDEKLSECSASATGVYIRVMCLMHKNDPYGKILLKQKNKQTTNQIKNFASQLAKQMPYDFHTVANALVELIDENVLLMENGVITQKRMVRDNEISVNRASSGKKGGKKTQKKNKDFALANALAKSKANSEYENEYENDNDFLEKGIGGMGGRGKNFLIPQMLSVFKKFQPEYPEDEEKDFAALGELSRFILKKEGISVSKCNDKESEEKILASWGTLSDFISKENFFKSYSLSQISKHIQSIIQKFKNGDSNPKNGKSNVDLRSALEKLSQMSD